jgi:hypothetical protein
LIDSEVYLGLPDLQITGTERTGGEIRILALYTGAVACPNCSSTKLRKKDSYERSVRHEGFGRRHCTLVIRAHKW